MFREAARIVEDGLATAEQVDEVVRSSFGFRLPFFGPFTIADMAGLDVYADIFETLERGLGPGFSAPELLHGARREGRVRRQDGTRVPRHHRREADELIDRRDRAYVALSRLRRELERVTERRPDASCAAARRSARDRDRRRARDRARGGARPRRGRRETHALRAVGGRARCGRGRGARSWVRHADTCVGDVRSPGDVEPTRRGCRRARRSLDLRDGRGAQPARPDARAAGRRFRPRRRHEPPWHLPHVPRVRRGRRRAGPRRRASSRSRRRWARSATPAAPRTARASTP